MSRLVHFSSEPVLKVHDRWNGPGHLKPRGLWFSVEGNGDGWSDWCKSEGFHLDGLTYASEIILTDDANVLWITTDHSLRVFTEAYGAPAYPRFDSSYRTVDWVRVSEEWGGLIITPYLWESRWSDETFWYYGWDCASGCVWDTSTIRSITPVATAELFGG